MTPTLSILKSASCSDHMRRDRDDVIDSLRAKIREVVGDLRAIDAGRSRCMSVFNIRGAGTSKKEKATM